MLHVQGNAAAFAALAGAGARLSAVSLPVLGGRGGGRSCAHLAAGAGAVDILRALPAGAAALRTRDDAGRTPWDTARALGSAEALAWLRAAGVAGDAAAYGGDAVAGGGEFVDAVFGVDAASGQTEAASGGWRAADADDGLWLALRVADATCAVLTDVRPANDSVALGMLQDAVLLQRPLALRGVAAGVRARVTMARAALLTE